jgi:hypothetical protein
MPAVFEGSVSTTDQNGDNVDVSGVVLPVLVPDADIPALLAGYDPANQYSPSATESRALARVLLDALLIVRGG